jgi:hypothetical protein
VKFLRHSIERHLVLEQIQVGTEGATPLEAVCEFGRDTVDQSSLTERGTRSSPRPTVFAAKSPLLP